MSEITHKDMISQLKDDVKIKYKDETIFDENIALAILLLDEQIFLNSYYWKSKNYDDRQEEAWPESACEVTALCLNTNDVLMWGCADAIPIEYSELRDIYDHWEKDHYWGTAIWYCKKLNMMPQKVVADHIRKMGIWDIDNMGLNKNPSEVE